MRRQLILVSCALLLVSCSSSTDGDDEGNGVPPRSTTFYGYFIDDAVQNLQYRVAGGPSGTTDQYGTFFSDAEKQMEFFVDSVSIGTVSEGLTRITPASLGSIGTNVARFLQSLDTTPATPGIDLTGINLTVTSINFLQGGSSFGSDPNVLQAVADAAQAGASGILVDATTAINELNAGTNSALATVDFADVAMFPVDPGADSEPCFVRFDANGTGESICRDDVIDDPTGAAAAFTWSVDSDLATLEFSSGGNVEERVTVQRLGTTGNRISAQVGSERLNCNPNVEPCIEGGVQTLITALPTQGADFSGKTITFTGLGPTRTAVLNANGTGTLSSNGTVDALNWSVDAVFDNVLLLRGVGVAGSEMIYHELILIGGSVNNGTFAALFAHATDTDNSTFLDDAEVAATREYESVESLSATSN